SHKGHVAGVPSPVAGCWQMAPLKGFVYSPLSVGWQRFGFELAVLAGRDNSHDPDSRSLFEFLTGRLRETFGARPFKTHYPSFISPRRYRFLKPPEASCKICLHLSLGSFPLPADVGGHGLPV